MPVKFHLDENVSPVIAVALHRRGIDVTTSQETGLRTSDDLEQLAFAVSQQRVLVTQDVDFLKWAKTLPHCGIVFNHNR